MRQFALTNNVGESYELNDLRNFFHDPNGLGFVRNSAYVKLGDQYEILSDSFEQGAPTGIICFKDEKQSSAYAKYAEFSRFMQKIPLTLIYRSDKDHRIRVVPESVTKSEISKPLGLEISITFRALSLWYDQVEKSGVTSVSIQSGSVRESPVHIAIKGPINNPIWTHNLNGTEIATGKVTATIASGQWLHVRTDTNPYQIYREVSGTITDIYADSDFSTQRFMHLREGLNTFTCPGASEIIVTGEEWYETV